MKVSSRLATSLFGIYLRTPVLAASGTFGYGAEFKSLLDLESIGGLVLKGLSREPIAGNPPPRLFETRAGMINSVGLQNMGVRAFLRDRLPELRKIDVPIFANIFGHTIDDYVEVARVLEDAEGLAAYELNVSCPNTKRGGLYFSSHPGLLSEVVWAVRAIARRPLIVKLSPQVDRIEPLAKAAAESGADGLSLINTIVALAIDARTRRPRLGAGFGGLSGPAIKPIALRLVYEAAQAVKIPILGIGGVATGLDAAEFLIAGASAVQVGTANFFDPRATVRIAQELESFLEQENIPEVRQLVGTLKFSPQREIDAERRFNQSRP
ncbi:MAG TPA: dihydroorotate dehydrogenase [Bryobacteraceae bacterium]|nr:dihydroorotate dehydrogenase [Bryobacteraceae bacterium]